MKFMFSLICLGVACYVVVVAMLYFFQEKFLFFPGYGIFGNCPAMKRYQASAETAGEIRYYLRADASPENWVVVFHGNAGNACDRTYFFDLLKGLPSNIVLFEYPGFGKDANVPGESVILKQALELMAHIKERNSEERPVFLLGESLGTGVATFAATQTAVSGLILFSAYPSISQVARHHYPWAPVSYLMKHPFNADIWARQTEVPALFFHGVNDDIIPIHLGRGQIKNFKGRTEMVEIPHCGHNDLIDPGEPLIRDKIKGFMSGRTRLSP